VDKGRIRNEFIRFVQAPSIGHMHGKFPMQLELTDNHEQKGDRK
jgi:hypothetical protein